MGQGDHNLTPRHQRIPLKLIGGGIALVTFSLGLAWGWQQSQNASIAQPIDIAVTHPNPSTEAAGSSEPLISAVAINRFREALAAAEAGQAQAVLTHLEGLESEISILTDEIVMMRAEAYETLLNSAKAQHLWTQILDQFPESPIVPRALHGLGRDQELIDRFPRHPLTAKVLLSQLQVPPDQIDVIRQLATHHPTTPNLTPLLDRWTQLAADSITPEEWNVIGDAYWEQREYGKASRAYDQAPFSPQTLYRHARSHHISKEYGPARDLYQTLITDFPDAPDVALGRRRYAAISGPQTAITILNPLATSTHPDAPEALLSLIQIYEKASSPQSAQATRQDLWTRFPTREAAAIAAWDLAWAKAGAGDLSGAIAIGEPIANAQRDHEVAAQLSYWIGKWFEQLGDQQAAQTAYQRTLLHYPHSYYAWRSAQHLGWPVGDFSVGRAAVEINYVPQTSPLPLGSKQLQLLHSIGARSSAWRRWQWETRRSFDPNFDPTSNPTPEEIFMNGLLRNAAGDHLKGINEVASLLQIDPNQPSDPADPESIDPTLATSLDQLKQRSDFWEAVYPLHFLAKADNTWSDDHSIHSGIAQWAQEFNLNPLMTASLIRQESRFEPQIVSRSGAIGLMQVMPATGQWIAGQLGLQTYELSNPADNLYLGSWYLDYTHRTYENNTLLALASYNGGPGNVAKWINRYGLSDLDLFVEQIPFPETRGYVKSVLGNYWNYWQIYTAEGSTLISQRLRQLHESAEQ